MYVVQTDNSHVLKRDSVGNRTDNVSCHNGLGSVMITYIDHCQLDMVNLLATTSLPLNSGI